LHRIPSALRSKFAEAAAFVNVSLKETLTLADFSLLAFRVATAACLQEHQTWAAPSPQEQANQEENSLRD
jgi:hypothetical protein